MLQIKKCLEKRKLAHCGECAVFGCKKLQDFSKIDGGELVRHFAELREKGRAVRNLLTDNKYAYLSMAEREFVIAFDAEAIRAGYGSRGIEPYLCFGRYQIEYKKGGAKKTIARIYITDDGIVFRLYLKPQGKHREYLESAPDFIKQALTGTRGDCKVCKDNCTSRKTYTINDTTYAKCAGESFYFTGFSTQNIPAYLELIRTCGV